LLVLPDVRKSLVNILTFVVRKLAFLILIKYNENDDDDTITAMTTINFHINMKKINIKYILHV